MYLYYSSFLKSIVFFEKILNSCLQYLNIDNKPNFSILFIKYILLTHIVCRYVCFF